MGITFKNLNRRLKSFILDGAKTVHDSKLLGRKRFFTIEEAAEYLNMSPKTIYNQRSAGTFPVKGKRFGKKKVLFEVSEIIRYADSL